MQESTIEVESNVLAFERLKGESDRGVKDKKRQKEEKLPSTSNQQSSKDKIDEMSKMIKRLTSKLAKLEMEGGKCHQTYSRWRKQETKMIQKTI